MICKCRRGFVKAKVAQRSASTHDTALEHAVVTTSKFSFKRTTHFEISIRGLVGGVYSCCVCPLLPLRMFHVCAIVINDNGPCLQQQRISFFGLGLKLALPEHRPTLCLSHPIQLAQIEDAARKCLCCVEYTISYHAINKTHL